MKKFFILFCSLLLGTVSFAFSLTIDEKLLQAFKISFPNAEEVNWYESKDAYVASFKENGVRARAVYKRDGQLRSLVRSYNEENLPYPVQFKVKQDYPDKKIFGVVELTVTENNFTATEYHIKMEDEKNWYTVVMDSDGFLTVTERFRKAQ